MIPIPRSLAHTLRGVFRRLVKRADGRQPVLSFRTDRTGLAVRLHHTEVRAELHQAGSGTPETLTLPFEALADFEGRGNGLVTLERVGPDHVQARWDDAGVPEVHDYTAPEAPGLSPFPTAPTRLQPAGPGLLKALADASSSAARDGVRYALDKIQLRGRAGTIVGTDGHQLLIQSGFQFPFSDDLLIPSSTLFGCKELAGVEDVALGADPQFVTLQAGAWTFHLPIDRDGRFPKTDQIVPSTTAAVTRGRLSPDDASFLKRTLPRLPGSDDEHAPVTVDLNGHVVVRARGSEQQRITEVVLARSEATGKAVRFCVNRTLLTRALDLGFTEWAVVDASTPIVCSDEHRKFVVMPLGKEGALGPSEDAVRIASTGAAEPVKARTPAKPQPEPVAPQPLPVERNGHPQGRPQPAIETPRPRQVSGSVVHDLLAEAAALKDVLRDAFTRTHRLMAGLQRHKKQSRVVTTTLASLRQLQHIEAP